MAGAAGMLHDLGKYTPCFQKMLTGARIKCPHAIHGALAVVEDPTGQKRAQAYPVAAIIAAHHAGLKDSGELKELLLAKDQRSEDRAALQAFWAVALVDQPGILAALRSVPASKSHPRVDLQIRMLLSCLVDADRLDTAGRRNVQLPLNAEKRLAQLERHLTGLASGATESGTAASVLAARASVQEACRASASREEKLFSLSVPTGGGKTLAAMRFALERAVAQPEEYRRIVVVIPYLSIIEQNAQVYRRVFGEESVLEHHSGAIFSVRPAVGDAQATHFLPQDEESSSATDPALAMHRPETENWDAPMIVTTSVRFFESLFSNHPSDLRRVHNLARSIIILDEVQTLPRRLLAPLLAILRELTEQWGCTLLMMTATQPAFEQRAGDGGTWLWPRGTVREIIPEPAALHRALQRVRIEWRLAGSVSWCDLATELLDHAQALCVVNIRDHAATLYGLLCAAGGDRLEDIFHLSTRMCAQHRLDVLGRIRLRLENGHPCLVVSTQLIEAGVDLDFPLAYRALGPLDAIIQVAGRVDREGKATGKAGKPAGRLIVFKTEDGKTPPNEYAEATGVTQALASSRDLQPDDLIAMHYYFERYYGEADANGRGEDLAAMRGDRVLKFKTLSDQFEMISSRTRDVFVPYAAGAVFITDLMQSHHLDHRLLRSLQRFVVGLQPWEFDAARRAGLIVESALGSELWICSTAAYDQQLGMLTRQDNEQLIV
jgi:CRISPR-associated endonuclease/helicase Cas3